MSSTPSISSMSVVLLAWRARREAHAAVTHHERGHAVAERRVELVVPGDLAVVVRVDVDPARRDHRALGVDRAVAVEPAADRGDPVAVDADVAGEPCGPRAVDDRAAPDHQIVCHA